MSDTTTSEQSSDAASPDAVTDALKDAGERLFTIVMERAAQAATHQIESLTSRLTEYAEQGGPGLKAALSGGQALAEGKSPLRAAFSSGVTGVKESIKGIFSRNGDDGGGGGGGGGGGDALKAMNIVEDIDVGLPLRTTYDLWTQYEDFPSFMKKVETVSQESDEKTNWKAQVFWSHRNWEATTIEQVPDSHIVWRSQGAKGHVDGAVTFTELGPNLTKILLVLQYHPQGFVERTGNIWRAAGRRARLEFKHFRRHAMVKVLVQDDEVEGWRGEIRDSEVVKTHEDALEEEQQGAQETGPLYTGEGELAFDEQGELVYDEEGEPLYDEEGEPLYDEEGELFYDEEGEPVSDEDEEEPTDEEGEPVDVEDDQEPAEDEGEEVAEEEEEDEPVAAQGGGRS